MENIQSEAYLTSGSLAINDNGTSIDFYSFLTALGQDKPFKVAELDPTLNDGMKKYFIESIVCANNNHQELIALCKQALQYLKEAGVNKPHFIEHLSVTISRITN